MKIGSRIYRLLFQLSFVACCFVMDELVASSASAINQFRAPYSLTELLHDGLVGIQDSLEQIGTSTKEHSRQLLQMINEKLESLEALYVQMYAKSNLNEIRRDERHFLQGLIDRIDQMIQNLEEDDSYSSIDQQVLKKNIDLLQNLKEQIDS
jgi:hypothetical protein